MGPKKKRKKEEARIRAAMDRLVAAAREKGEQVRTIDAEVPPEEPMPALSVPARRTRGPQKSPTKQPISIRLDRDVVEELRRGGRGWQTRLNAMLREALSLDR